MDEVITTRTAAAADEEFLFRLFALQKAGEFAPLGWPAQQLQPLLEMQYRARQLSYAESFPEAVNTILCLADGTPVGRHLTARQKDFYRVVDIAVLPEYRGRGIGTWALNQMKQAAALESVPMRLSVTRTNPALRLYERLGFIRVSADDLSFEMEWHAPLREAASPRPQERMALENGGEAVREEVVARIADFLREIGLSVQFGPVPSTSFLPGIQTVSGGLRVDVDALLYPGDLLHEAGHLAVMTAERRWAEFPHTTEPAEEMAALAWSYAAARHIGLAPEIVFHEHGYRGQSKALVHDFSVGKCVGLPYLWWIGMTTQPVPGSPSIYPRMLHWLRQEPDAEHAGPQEYALEAHG